MRKRKVRGPIKLPDGAQMPCFDPKVPGDAQYQKLEADMRALANAVKTRAPLEAASVKAVIADAEARLSGTGRLVIRKSGTEPLIRVMAEGEDSKLVEDVVDSICDAVKAA